MKVRELLSDESKWTQGVSSRTGSGTKVAHNSPNAKSWCLYGAAIKCYESPLEIGYVLSRIAETIGSWCIADWNDAPDRTFGDVKNLVEKLNI
jgi:hypothetical protein